MGEGTGLWGKTGALECSAVFELHVLRAKEGLQFRRTEVGEDLAVPVERRRLGLTRLADHLVIRRAIGSDVHLAVANADFIEQRRRLVAPRTTGFHIQHRKVFRFHGGTGLKVRDLVLLA